MLMTELLIWFAKDFPTVMTAIADPAVSRRMPPRDVFVQRRTTTLRSPLEAVNPVARDGNVARP
jgi:hypothetical protein